jgi:hypothetical protein
VARLCGKSVVLLERLGDLEVIILCGVVQQCGLGVT